VAISGLPLTAVFEVWCGVNAVHSGNFRRVHFRRGRQQRFHANPQGHAKRSLAEQAQTQALGIDAAPLLDDADCAITEKSGQDYHECTKQISAYTVAQSTGSRSHGALSRHGQGRGQEAQPGSVANNRPDDGRKNA